MKHANCKKMHCTVQHTVKRLGGGVGRMSEATFCDAIIEVPEEAERELARNAEHTFSVRPTRRKRAAILTPQQNMSSETPRLEVGGVLYQGTVSHLIGSHLLFDAHRKRCGGYAGAATVRIVFTRCQNADASKKRCREPDAPEQVDKQH